MGDGEARERELDAALDETDRLEATIADLLAHARQASTGTAVTINLGSVAHEHAARWQPVFAALAARARGRRRQERARQGLARDGRPGARRAARQRASPRRGRDADHGVRGRPRRAHRPSPTAGPAWRRRSATASSSAARRGPEAPASASTSRARWRSPTTAACGLLEGEPTRFELRLPRLGALVELGAVSERELRAGVRGAARVDEQLLRDRAAVDDRIAPLVELDPLREQLGAQPVAGAGDRVDAQGAPSRRHAPRGAGERQSVGGGDRRGMGPSRAWSASSAPKTRSPLARKPDGAVGQVAGAAAGDVHRSSARAAAARHAARARPPSRRAGRRSRAGR